MSFQWTYLVLHNKIFQAFPLAAAYTDFFNGGEENYENVVKFLSQHQ